MMNKMMKEKFQMPERHQAILVWLKGNIVHKVFVDANNTLNDSINLGSFISKQIMKL